MPATLSPAIMMGEIAAAIQVLQANFLYFVTTVKARAVDWSILFNFGTFWSKVTVHKHQIFPS